MKNIILFYLFIGSTIYNAKSEVVYSDSSNIPNTYWVAIATWGISKLDLQVQGFSMLSLKEGVELRGFLHRVVEKDDPYYYPKIKTQDNIYYMIQKNENELKLYPDSCVIDSQLLKYNCYTCSSNYKIFIIENSFLLQIDVSNLDRGKIFCQLYKREGMKTRNIDEYIIAPFVKLFFPF